jgi:hypothetical protein
VRTISTPHWKTWRDSFLLPSAKVTVTHKTPPTEILNQKIHNLIPASHFGKYV